MARFKFHVDPSIPSVTVEPLEGSRSAQAQGFLFDLDIENFRRPDTLVVTGFDMDPEGFLTTEFTHRHPYSAPDFNAPISASNRADLGYSGRLVILADNQSTSFFGGQISLDPTGIKNPDGFINVGAILADQSLDNNTFPYILLADEAKDNRVGVTNEGVMTGNYEFGPGGNGWHRGNAGTNNDEWTGFDFVHQGQTVTNTFTMLPAALGFGPFDLEAAIVIKYTDPRQGDDKAELKSNRFPPATPDFNRFAYRLPHAAMDSSSVKLENRPAIIALAGSCSNVDFRFRDWDNFGVAGADADLTNDALLNTVAPGAKTAPVAVVDAPFLSLSQPTAILRNFGTGAPGAEIQYSVRLDNSLGTVTPGFRYALIKVTDPETGNDAGYHYGVDPVSLQPDFPLVESVYQVVALEVKPAPLNQPAQPPGILGSPCEDGGQGGGPATFNSPPITNNPTSIDWNFGGGTSPNTATGASPAVNFVGASGSYTGYLTASNAFGTSPPTFFTYQVGNPTPDSPLSITVTPPSDVIPNNSFLDLVVNDFVSAGTPEIQFDWNSDGDFADFDEGLQLVGQLPQIYSSPIPVTNPGVGPVTVVLPYSYQDGILGPFLRTLSFTIGPGFVPPGWARTFGSVGNITIPHDIAVDADGNSYVVGEMWGATDFGGGVRAHSGAGVDMFVARYDRTGGWYWDNTYAFAASDRARSVAVDPVGRVYVGCGIIGAGTFFSGGALPPDSYLAVVSYDPSGNLLDDIKIGTGGATATPKDLSIQGDAIIVGGIIEGGVYNLGGGVSFADYEDGLIVKLDPTPSLTYVWDAQITGTSSMMDEAVLGITSAPSGDVYVTGYAASPSIDFGAGPVGNVNDQQAFLAKYSPAGSSTWARLIGAAFDDIGYGVAYNSAVDQIVVGGEISIDTDFGGGLRDARGASDAFVASYTPANAYAWDWHSGFAGYEWIKGLGIDGFGNVVTTGFFGDGNANFGAGWFTDLGGNVFAFRLTAAGNPSGASFFGGDPNMAPTAMAATQDSEIRICGTFQATADFNPDPLVFSRTPLGSDAFVTRQRASFDWAFMP